MAADRARSARCRTRLSRFSTDGGHFELSPMYHAIILEDVLDLIQLGRIFPVAARGAGAGMAGAGRADAGVACRHDAIRMAKSVFSTMPPSGSPERTPSSRHMPRRSGLCGPAVPKPLRSLAASGYARLQVGSVLGDFRCRRDRPVLFARSWPCRRSLARSFARRPAASDQWRNVVLRRSMRCGMRSDRPPLMLRVEIDGHNSSEVWASFRVGRRAHPFDVAVSGRKAGAVVGSSQP